MEREKVLLACHESKISSKPKILEFSGISYVIKPVDGGWVICDVGGYPLATRETPADVASWIEEREKAQAEADEIMREAQEKVADAMGGAIPSNMTVKRDGETWVAYDVDGNELGRFKTEAEAQDRFKLDIAIRQKKSGMDFKVAKRGAKWVVLDESGEKVLGTHDTEAAAKAQLGAIEAAKARKGKSSMQADFSHEREMEVLSVGTWKDSRGREVTFTEDDLHQIARDTMKNLPFIGAPLKLGHDDGQKIVQNSGLPALGWLKGLYVRGKKLIAHYKDIPDLVNNCLLGKAYKRVSSELSYGWQNPETGEKCRIFSGLALLGAELPAIQNLADIAALGFKRSGVAVSTVSLTCDERQVFTFEQGGEQVSNEPKKDEPAFDASKYVTVEAFQAMKDQADKLRLDNENRIKAEKSRAEKVAGEKAEAILSFATSEETLRIMPAGKDALKALVDAVKADHVAKFSVGAEGKSLLELVEDLVKAMPDRSAIFSGKPGTPVQMQAGTLTMEQAIVEANKLVSESGGKVEFRDAISIVRLTKGIRDDGAAVMDMKTGVIVDRR